MLRIVNLVMTLWILVGCTEKIVKTTARPTNEEGEIPGYLQQTEYTIESDAKFVSIGSSRVEIPGNVAFDVASPRVRLGRLSAEGIAALNADAQFEINNSVSEDVVSISYVDGEGQLIGSDSLNGDYEFRTMLRDGVDATDLKALIVTDPGTESEATYLSDVETGTDDDGSSLALVSSKAFAKLRLSATQLIITIVLASSDSDTSNIIISNRVKSSAGSDSGSTANGGDDVGGTAPDASNPNLDPGLELQSENTWMATSALPNESTFLNANFYGLTSGPRFSLAMALNSTATTNVWSILDHSNHQWSVLDSPSGLEARKQAGIVISGAKAIVWGGYRDNIGSPFADGGIIDLVAKDWESESLPSLNAPPAGVDPVLNCALANGRIAIWGLSATTSSDKRNQGSLWDIEAGEWIKIPEVGGPSSATAIGSATCDAENNKAFILTSSSNPQLYVLDLADSPTWQNA
jgi:hypothetical protein